ncbi:glycosyl transferase group 1 [Methanohalobium evestigatum Z-7303]|uniref:Glycosyl transferase group 1 n=1 Tax=Methanohalobium evestigatum (strain ATCC BAA-1072 / DSM 3721 / NBRC 107634 / OCM 161 / Z-7303) TaxID=644295 RepID=D7E8C8_METEZ|nr:glycosyl transferase group 1 [Methanohalobium evestigatum Z-7303]
MDIHSGNILSRFKNRELINICQITICIIGGVIVKEGKYRIGMFSWESLHAVKVGGIAPHVTELSEALAEKGHEVHIVTRNDGNHDAHDIINGVHYHRIVYDPSGDVIHQMNKMCDAMYSTFLEVRDEYGEFDVLHGHDWHPVTVLCRLKHELGLPFVLTYHSTEWGRNGNRHNPDPIAQEITQREWLGGYESSEVIVTSQVLYDEVVYLYQIPDYKISIVPNGTHINKIRRNIDPGSVKKKYGIHPLAPIVLFIGRMNYQKGPDLLVESVPMILNHRQDVQFVFIGEGDMRSHCEYLAETLGVSDSCHFLGYASDEAAIDWYNACNVVCMPSRNEPFGIVVLEAWDAGKPVVASDAVKLVDNFKNGVVVYKYPESIAWGVNYVVDGLGDDSMGNFGRELVETKYNWTTIAVGTLEVYNRVIQV